MKPDSESNILIHLQSLSQSPVHYVFSHILFNSFGLLLCIFIEVQSSLISSKAKDKTRNTHNCMAAICPVKKKKQLDSEYLKKRKSNKIKYFSSVSALTEAHLQIRALVHITDAHTPSSCDIKCPVYVFQSPKMFCRICWCSWAVSEHLNPLTWKFSHSLECPWILIFTDFQF